MCHEQGIHCRYRKTYQYGYPNSNFAQKLYEGFLLPLDPLMINAVASSLLYHRCLYFTSTGSSFQILLGTEMPLFGLRVSGE